MDFTDILNTKVSEIEKPPVLPQGTYTWKVTKMHRENKTNNGDWIILEIPVTPVSADDEADDIDPDDLEAFGNLAAGSNSIRFMFPTAPDREADVNRATYNLRKFLTDVLQVSASEDATLKELLAGAIGCEFRAQAVHRYDADRDTTFVDVKSWMPID